MKKNRLALAILVSSSLLGTQAMAQESLQEILQKRKVERAEANAATQPERIDLNKQEASPKLENGKEDLYVRENGLPPVQDDSPYAKATASEKEKTQTIIINDNGLPVPVELTVGEVEFLQARKERLSQYLYENYQLDEVRKLLLEYNRKKAFDQEYNKRYSTKPHEIMQMRLAEEKESLALNTPIRPVKNHIRTVDLNIEDDQPLEIFVTRGLASSIVFFDSTGAPWPVEGEVIGDQSAYSSSITTSSKNVVTFSILKEFTTTNALITLKGMSIPLVVKLSSNGHDNDDRLSARIPHYGPNANVQLYAEDEFENKNNDMVKLLNGKKPEEAKMYYLNGVSGQVFMLGEKMYLKTFENLVSPAWNSQLTSTSGYKVYELNPVTKLLFNVNGNLIQAEVENLSFYDIKYAKTPFEE